MVETHLFFRMIIDWSLVLRDLLSRLYSVTNDKNVSFFDMLRDVDGVVGSEASTLPMEGGSDCRV